MTPPEKPGTETGEPGDTGTITVTAFDGLESGVKVQSLPLGAPESDVNLPATLGASGYVVSDDTEPVPTHIQIESVTWELTGEKDTPTAYEEGREKPCNYYFQPVVPEGYELAGSAVLPKIEVRYGWGNRASTSYYNADDVAAFQQILADHPTLKTISGVDENDPASWERAGLVQWDTSSLKRITQLSLYDKGLTGTLDVGNLTNLTSLNCNNNQLTALNGLGNLASLEILSCKDNQLGTLDGLGNLTSLTDLSCDNNKLETLDGLGNLTSLEYLYCDNNQLTALDVSNLTNLKPFGISCSGNPLQSHKTSDGTLTINAGTHGIISIAIYELSTKRVTLAPVPDTGYTFGDWTVLPSGITPQDDNTIIFELNGDKEVAATFISTDATLKALSLSAGMLTPAFDPMIEDYTASVDNGVTSVTITATPKDSNAKVSGDGAHDLKIGDNPFTITVTAEDGITTQNYTVTVRKAPPATISVTGVTLDQSAYTLHTDKDPRSVQLAATVEPADASNKAVSWASSDTSIATVDSSGNVTAVKEGTAIITVTTEDGNKTDTCTVTVRNAPPSTISVTGVTLDQTAYTLHTDKDPRSVQLIATVEPADASNKTVSWQSSDTSTATVDGSGNVTAVKEGTATITVTTEDGNKTDTCAITVKTESGSGNSGSGGGGSNYTTTPEPPKPDTPVLPVIELPVSVTGGSATGTVDDGNTSAALNDAGAKTGTRQNGIAVQYDAKTSLSYDGFSIVIQRGTLDRLIAAKVKFITLNTSVVDMTFDLMALQEIQKQTTGDITLTAAKENGLAGDVLAAVGSRPAYQLTVGYTGADGKTAAVTSFGAGRVTVGLAYKPAENEQTGSLYLIYSADGKGAEWLYQSSYDRNSGNVTASTGHFSVYGVGYRTAPAFTDTLEHWAKPDIDFVVSRGLFSGTSETTFSPDGTITRGLFITALGRLAGIDPAAYSSSQFNDVAATAYYAPYVEWAASKGIVSGTGDNAFSPDAPITREQMAVIMRQYADKLGYTLPVVREAVTFTDDNQITGSMKDAVQRVQQAGIMSGKDNNRFGPKDAATRAEAAVVLRRFVEVVIGRDTAGGWGQNDAGKWLYYENNKPVTGWKQVDGTWYYFDGSGLMQAGGWREIGGKWYYFFPDGAMAVNIKIDGYEIGPDGVCKE